MKTAGTQSNRSIQGAAAAAVFFLLASGAAFHTLANQLARPVESMPLPPGTLAKLPLTIGAWTGQDVAVDSEIIQKSDTDDSLNRVYFGRVNAFQKAEVELYVAYGLRGRDLVPHRPEVCYPSHGWTAGGRETVEIALPGGPPIQCSLYHFYKGGFDLARCIVLNYYIVDGETCPDVSLLRSKATRGTSGIRYMARVMVSCRFTDLNQKNAVSETVRTFARDAAPLIRALLPDATARAGDPR